MNRDIIYIDPKEPRVRENVVVFFPKDYNPLENAGVNVDNIIVATTLQRDLALCPFGKVVDAVNIVAGTWGLRPNRAKEFKTIKRIIFNSIIKN